MQNKLQFWKLWKFLKSDIHCVHNVGNDDLNNVCCSWHDAPHRSRNFESAKMCKTSSNFENFENTVNTSGWEGRNLFHEFSACQRTGASADPSDPSPLIQNVLFIGPSLPLWVLFGKYGVLQWISEGLKLHFKVLFSGVYQKILEIRWPEWTLGRWEVSPVWSELSSEIKT